MSAGRQADLTLDRSSASEPGVDAGDHHHHDVEQHDKGHEHEQQKLDRASLPRGVV